MRTLYYFFLPVAVVLMLAGCTEDSIVNDFETEKDSCDTKAPLSHTDSIHAIQPTPSMLIRNYRQLPQYDLSIGVVESTGYKDGDLYSGVFIRDRKTGDALLFNGWYYDINPAGDKILISIGWSKAGVIEVDVKNGQIVNTISGFTQASYPTDGNGYFVRDDGRRLFKLTDTDTTFIGRAIDASKPLDDSTLVVIQGDGVYLFDINNKSMRQINVDLGGHLNPGVLYWDVSVEDRMLLLPRIDGVMDNQSGGLYVVDLDNESAYMLLSAPYWSVSLHPTWSGHGTFYATHYCRCDSVAMIHEYNLSGNVVGKVTEPHWNYGH
ncbi:MAG: hypothetical protein RRA94_04385 [Bacteroidota bacterium]|nr:hypothetical protein [Bacteroidota bacterium]